MSAGRPTADRCPLCEARGAERRGEAPYEEIWRRFAADWGIELPASVRARHAPQPSAPLWRCRVCGLDFFAPAPAGDQEFYEALMRATPYLGTRWEFERAGRLVAPGSSVADFGCGEGAFLKTLRGRAGRLAGVDLNTDAVARLGETGIEATAAPFDEFATAHAGAFDVTCSFHVLEHMSRPYALLEPMVASTRPGGCIAVAVPNRERWDRDPLDPMDCPPHHLTRWGAGQLRHAADHLGLEVLRILVEPPTYPAAIGAVMAPIDRRLGAGWEHDRRRVLRGLARQALIGPRRHDALARRGGYARLGVHGQSLLAVMRRPAA